MFTPLFVILLAALVGDQPATPTGTILGTVVNGSSNDQPLADATVVLRASQNGQLEPVAKTITDHDGRFSFEDVPIDPSVTFLPGAERGGVHYPGQRFQLGYARPDAVVRLRVFDAIKSPSPLRSLRHNISLMIEDQILVVTETILIANRSTATYVGEPVGTDSPVTLGLTIPPNFDRVTFGNEFFGRRFRVADHRPITDIAWPPGERELSFTYRIPLEKSEGFFRRTLDIPTDEFSLTVQGEGAKKLNCNLPPDQKLDGKARFANSNQPLPAGHAIELQIGDLPLPWAQYSRWAALTLLGLLILATTAVKRFHKKTSLGQRDHEVQGKRQKAVAKQARRAA